jgi:hypothetical protein
MCEFGSYATLSVCAGPAAAFGNGGPSTLLGEVTFLKELACICNNKVRAVLTDKGSESTLRVS